MQDECISLRTKRLLERLKELWEYPHELTYETVERIILELPEEDRALGIQALAEHLVSIMKLHFLDIVATFRQRAEEEEISAEERDEIVHDVIPEAFQIIQKSGSQ